MATLVQNGSITLTAASTTVTLGTAVDTSKTFILITQYDGVGNTSFPFYWAVEAYFPTLGASETSVNFDTGSYTAGTPITVYYQVVTLDNISVTHINQVSVASGDTLLSNTISISATNKAAALVTAWSSTGTSANSGMALHAADITSTTNCNVTRGVSGATGQYTLQIIEFTDDTTVEHITVSASSTTNNTTTSGTYSTTQAFVFYSFYGSDASISLMPLPYLSGSTTLACDRSATSAGDVATVQAYIVNMTGCTVAQYTAADVSSTTQAVTITSVGDITQAFSVLSMGNSGTGTVWGNAIAGAILTTTTNINIYKLNTTNTTPYNLQVVRLPGRANAALATGTGAALAPAIELTAGLATGTGAALAPGIEEQGGSASSTGATGAPGVELTPALAAGTGTSQSPAPAVVCSAGLAHGTGAALATGIELTPALAHGTGNAQSPAPAIVCSAGLASGAGAALAPGSDLTPALAHGTGSALAPGIGEQGGSASSTGATGAPGVELTPALASATGTAFNPTASQGGTANAGLAAGTGTAFAPGIGEQGGSASSTGAAGTPGVELTPALAAGTGTAFAPGIEERGGSVSSTGAAGTPGIDLTPALAHGNGSAFAPGTGLTPGLASAVAAALSIPPATVTGPALVCSGFGSWSQVPAGSLILSVIANVTQVSSNLSMDAPVYQLWDGTSSMIDQQTGTLSTSVINDSVVFTGVTYAQLATLQLQIFGVSTGSNSGATFSVDAVSLSVTWAPSTSAAISPDTLRISGDVLQPSLNTSMQLAPALASASGAAFNVSFPRNAAVAPAALQVPASFPLPAISVGSKISPAVLTVVTALPAITDVTVPNWASAESATGWTNPGHVTGTPDGSYGIWTVP